VGSVTYSFTSGGANFTTFTGAATGNTTFLAGQSGGYTFDGNGSNNELDLSAVAAALEVNVSGTTLGSVPNDTATASGVSYAFSDISTVTGSASGHTTFDEGTSAVPTFIGRGSDNELNFSALTTALTVNVSGTTVGSVPNDTATSSGTSYELNGISTFVGSSAGGTTFVAGGTGGYSFEGSGSGNKADFSVDPNPITANLFTGSVTVGSGSTDTISDISSVVGSSGGGNSFIAGTQSENFADTGSAGGDSLNLSNVPTSGSTPLTINVSGGPAGGGIANDTATVGSVTYSFTSGGANFTTFTGAATGNTTFLAGQSGGYTFDGNGSNNELDLSAVHSGATLSANGDSMASPGTVTGLEPGLAGSTTDSFAGIQSFAGYPGDAITSVNNASASHGAHLSFTVTTTGMPAPKLTKEGKLPKGVSFHSNGNGTATISGTPSAKSSGSYRLTIKARFGKGKTKVVCVQAFTLTVT
jgi:hypothetical protein